MISPRSLHTPHSVTSHCLQLKIINHLQLKNISRLVSFVNSFQKRQHIRLNCNENDSKELLQVASISKSREGEEVEWNKLLQTSVFSIACQS